MTANSSGSDKTHKQPRADIGAGASISQKLTLPLTLEDGRVPGLFASIAYLTTFLLAACLVWAAIGQIRELSVAKGQVIPFGSVKFVHHLEGGLVDQIFVHEGQLVRKGDRLVRLKPIAATSQLNELRARQAYLQLQLQRIEALIGGGAPNFSSVGNEYTAQASAELNLLMSERRFRQREREQHTSTIEQQLGAVRSLREELVSRTRQVKLHESEVERLSDLHRRRLTTRSQYLQARFRHENAVSDEIGARGRLLEAEKKLDRARVLLEESNARSMHTYTAERSRITTELAEIREKIQKQTDEVERLHIRAPVHGIIQQLTSQSSGEVVKPGGLVAKIVPVDVGVVAEVRLDPKDSGHVKPGDDAELNISTYDPILHGTVKGKVKSISPTTFLSEENTPYYKVILSLEKSYVGEQPHANPIVPGMEVKANIVTGTKSLMVYFLKPINKSLKTAFTER